MLESRIVIGTGKEAGREERGIRGHYNRLRYSATGESFCGKIARLELEVGFILGDSEVVVHVPGDPGVALLFDIKESDINARLPGPCCRQTRVLLLFRNPSPRRPVIVHPELPMGDFLLSVVRLIDHCLECIC